MAGFKAVLPSTLLGTLPVGAWLYMDGKIALPIFLAGIIIPFGLMKFGFGLEQLTYMAANLNPIRDFLNTPEQQRPQTPVMFKDSSFAFDRVGFSYDGTTQVLKDLSFTAHPGKVTAIVGPSGSGKSTIAKLMAGFWDATAGTVSFGGQAIQELTQGKTLISIAHRLTTVRDADQIIFCCSGLTREFFCCNILALGIANQDG